MIVKKVPSHTKEFLLNVFDVFFTLFFYVCSQFIQTLYFLVALLNDFAGTNETLPKKKPILRKIRDYLFAAFAVPLAINVSGMFWLLYAIDRKLVLPESMDAYFPGWYNHIGTITNFRV